MYCIYLLHSLQGTNVEGSYQRLSETDYLTGVFVSFAWSEEPTDLTAGIAGGKPSVTSDFFWLYPPWILLLYISFNTSRKVYAQITSTQSAFENICEEVYGKRFLVS